MPVFAFVAPLLTEVYLIAIVDVLALSAESVVVVLLIAFLDSFQFIACFA